MAAEHPARRLAVQARIRPKGPTTMDRTETVIERSYNGHPLKPITVITEDDGGYVLYVFTDYHDGRGPVLSMSLPSGRGAQYQEARDRGLAEARARMFAKRDAIVAHFGGAR